MMPNYREMDYTKLLRRFMNDIAFDCHSMRAKFERSMAQRELSRRGQKSLRPILDYLHKINFDVHQKFSTGEECDFAWIKLLHVIEATIDPNRTAPNDLRDIPGWIKWAETFA